MVFQHHTQKIGHPATGGSCSRPSPSVLHTASNQKLDGGSGAIIMNCSRFSLEGNVDSRQVQASNRNLKAKQCLERRKRWILLWKLLLQWFEVSCVLHLLLHILQVILALLWGDENVDRDGHHQPDAVHSTESEGSWPWDTKDTQTL